MMLAYDLEEADVCQHFGTDFAAGYADGALWCEYSCDRGATAAAFPDGSYRKRICDVEGTTKPTVLAYDTGQLQVWFSRDGKVRSFWSGNRGQTWTGV